MAEYLFIENDNNQIVIDDQYHNPTFLFKQSVITSESTPNTTMTVGGRYPPYTGKGNVIYLNQLDILDTPSLFPKRVFGFGRSKNNEPIEVQISVVKDSDGNEVGYQPTVYSFRQNDVVEVAVFYLGVRKPSDMGLVMFNENGDVVFDGLKGFLQVVDQLNIQMDPAGWNQSYKIHDNAKLVDFSKLFICSLYVRPFYVRGGTIVINYRAHYPRLIQNNNDIYVEFVPYGDNPSGAVVQNYNDIANLIIAYVPY